MLIWQMATFQENESDADNPNGNNALNVPSFYAACLNK